MWTLYGKIDHFTFKPNQKADGTQIGMTPNLDGESWNYRNPELELLVQELKKSKYDIKKEKEDLELLQKRVQKDIDQLNFGLIYNLTKFDAKIFFISLDEDNPEANDNLDDLIYSFNNNSIKINNWISLRSFVNKVLSSYSG